MAKYTVSAFTDKTAKDLLWPENTWDAETTEEIATMIHNCTRRMAGIRVVKILINEPDDREPKETKKDKWAEDAKKRSVTFLNSRRNND